MQGDTRRCRVYLFGPLEVSIRQEDGSWKLVDKSVWSQNDYAPSVLKRLLSVAGRRLSRGQIQEAIWPGLESGIENYLDRAISAIRKALVGKEVTKEVAKELGKELVKTWHGTYEVAGQETVWVDADAAEALVTQAENLGDR